MKSPEEWSRLDWLSAASGLAAVTVAGLAVWALLTEDSRVLAAFVVAWLGAMVVGGLLFSETLRQTARVGQRVTDVHRS